MRVLNDRTARVDRHDVRSVGGNQSIEVAKNQKEEVGGSYNLTVGGTGAAAIAALEGVAGILGQRAGLVLHAGALGGGAALAGFAASMASASVAADAPSRWHGGHRQYRDGHGRRVRRRHIRRRAK